MNTKLVESLLQVILSLSDEERLLLEERLFFDSSEASSRDLIQLAQIGGSFKFLEDEPDIYSLEDGEPI
ncbi:hypothetical protein I8752_16810 [Nostocaceae cyanobacterium CENA369]|uniref:Uncharacterized protein n=1 Tax=Dendronalium phyllosphericum CENA369 TaxID=1725256 RepID=A0A8J7I7T5_9NOST|nr:hypothetical protein [Dendronalium phyllosphericum]MBH8574655.1 hypothetical protein [Dendronalium phyllosphericum CENA369]